MSFLFNYVYDMFTVVEGYEAEGEEVNTELDKYWKAVRDNPGDFTGWTYLLQYVEQEVRDSITTLNVCSLKSVKKTKIDNSCTTSWIFVEETRSSQKSLWCFLWALPILLWLLEEVCWYGKETIWSREGFGGNLFLLIKKLLDIPTWQLHFKLLTFSLRTLLFTNL